MCGLVGFYPKKNKKVELPKLYALWVANEERGTHSCGITFGQNRYVGTYKDSKARDYIKSVHRILENTDLKNTPIIAHTRHATNGAHNQDNAHPFQWYRGKEENYFNFAHNGSLKELHKFKEKLKMSEKHDESLMGIDSHVLGLAVYDSYIGKLTEEEILTSYQGAAAFICHDCNNTFKVWKGANNNIEERPLYYLETSNGWYFSSLKYSLLFVDPSSEPIEVPNNTLITFKNYSLESQVVYERKVQEIFSTTYNNDSCYVVPHSNHNLSSRSSIINKLLSFNLSSILSNRQENKSIEENLPEDIVRFEITGPYKGRYTLKGKLLNGVYSFNYTPKIDAILPNIVDIADGDIVLVFKNGYLVDNPEDHVLIFQTYIDLKIKQNLTYQKIFENLKKLEHKFINIFPLFGNKNDIDMILFKDSSNNLNYFTYLDVGILHIKDVFNNTIRVKSFNKQIILEHVE